MAQTPSKTDLFLFDIDGTLIHSKGAGVKAMAMAIKDLYGVDDGLEGIEISGRTDKFVCQNVFRKLGMEYDPEREQELLDRYLVYLEEQLPLADGGLLPGVLELLEALKEIPTVSLGLLTGNIAKGAFLKLRQYGIEEYFELGAYADDHIDRNCLGPIAQKRAHERHQVHFAPERTFILGDTPHDIACGRAISAKTVGVATGIYSYEALAKHSPDFLFADFSEGRGLVEKLIGC